MTNVVALEEKGVPLSSVGQESRLWRLCAQPPKFEKCSGNPTLAAFGNFTLLVVNSKGMLAGILGFRCIWLALTRS